MDFGHAALLAAVLFGLVEIVKSVFPNLTARQVVLAALVLGQATVELVAHGTWAHTQIVNGTSLDRLNTADLIVVGLMLTLLAVAGNRLLGAVKNIGQNQA